jgi:hypothetical protein
MALYSYSNSVDDLSICLQKDFDLIKMHVMSANYLSINLVKSVCMLIGSPQRTWMKSLNICIVDANLTNVDVV